MKYVERDQNGMDLRTRLHIFLELTIICRLTQSQYFWEYSKDYYIKGRANLISCAVGLR